jgi:hypothetical protein
LENRIKELIEQQTIDENRIAMEVAIFAVRCVLRGNIKNGKSFKQLEKRLN